MIRMCVCLFFFCDYIYIYDFDFFFGSRLQKGNALTQLRGAEESHTVKKISNLFLSFCRRRKNSKKRYL